MLRYKKKHGNLDTNEPQIVSKVDKPNLVLDAPEEGYDLRPNEDATLVDSKGEVNLEDRKNLDEQKDDQEEFG